MTGKRKIDRKRTTKKKRTKKPVQVREEEDTKHELPGDDESMMVQNYLQSSKASRANSKKNTSTCCEKSSDDKEEKDSYVQDEPTNDALDDENDCESTDEEEERISKYDVRQRVLARDEDGILYYASIRRKLYGINHQQSISCLGIFDISPEAFMGTGETAGKSTKDGDEETNTNQSEWHYFVHYEGWKTNWDRWVRETDIWEVTPDNIERMHEISKSHKTFQLVFKEKTKKKKIQNGGLFVQQWKQRLDALNHRWDEKERQNKEGGGNDKESKTSKLAAAKRRKKTPKAKNNKSSEEMLRDQSKLTVHSCLVERQPLHIQAIPLSFGLKRILVEDWENLNNSFSTSKNDGNNTTDEAMNLDMVHVLPAKITIRYALSLYLKEKGISWGEGAEENSTTDKLSLTKDCQGKESSDRKFSTVSDKVEEVMSVDLPEEKVETNQSKHFNCATESTAINSEDKSDAMKMDANPNKSEQDDITSDTNEKSVSPQLVKEWTDMADGIVLYFEQSLMARLLYPSEVSQILVLEESLLDESAVEHANKNPAIPLKVDIYGCEHLLRLLSALPRILDQQLQDSRKKKVERKQNINDNKTTGGENEDRPDAKQDAFVEIGSMILAKLQDLARFLQKNQLTLFASMYRRKNEQEVKRDIKIQKRQEKRLKNAASTPVNNIHQNKQQEQDEVIDMASQED